MATSSKTTHAVPKRGALVSIRLEGLPEKRPHQWAPDSWPAARAVARKISHGLAIAEGRRHRLLPARGGVPRHWQFVDRNLVQHHIVNPEGGLLGRILSIPGWTDGRHPPLGVLLGFLGGAYATYNRPAHPHRRGDPRAGAQEAHAAARDHHAGGAGDRRIFVRRAGASTGHASKSRARLRKSASCSRRRAAR